MKKPKNLETYSLDVNEVKVKNPIVFDIDLRKAILNDDFDHAEALINAGADPRVRWGKEGRKGDNVFHFLAFYGENPRFVKLLAHAPAGGGGEGINAPSDGGETAIMLAVMGKKPQMVKAFLEANADPNKPNHYGGLTFFPIMEIVEGSSRDALHSIGKILYHGGANMNVINGIKGDNLLHLLAKQDNRVVDQIMVQFLIDCHVDPTRRNSDGLTARDILESREYLNTYGEYIERDYIDDIAIEMLKKAEEDWLEKHPSQGIEASEF